MRKLILASLTISSTLAAQSRPRTAPLRGSLERRLATLLDQPPFNRANWGVYVVEDGKVLFARNADRFYVPASNTKLVVSAAATVLLPADYRVTTSVYPNGRVDNGVLYGDLVLYGRGDPTWSERCFSVDSLAPGACDSASTTTAWTSISPPAPRWTSRPRSPGRPSWGCSPSRTAPAPCRRTRARPSATTSSAPPAAGTFGRKGPWRSAASLGSRASRSPIPTATRRARSPPP